MLYTQFGWFFFAICFLITLWPVSYCLLWSFGCALCYEYENQPGYWALMYARERRPSIEDPSGDPKINRHPARTKII